MEFAGGGGVITFHDERLARRRKALVRTVPLHDLDGSKGRDGARYQMAELALQVVDQVMVAMDFDRGAHVSRTMREPHVLLSRRYNMKASRILRYPENHERSQR